MTHERTSPNQNGKIELSGFRAFTPDRGDAGGSELSAGSLQAQNSWRRRESLVFSSEHRDRVRKEFP
jgi:hypothetical protein